MSTRLCIAHSDECPTKASCERHGYCIDSLVKIEEPIQDSVRNCFVTNRPCERECKIEEFCELYRRDKTPSADLINHPPHYTAHPSGVECITITEHMNFCLGNAVKYIWRAGEKSNAIEDLKKARWYLDREISNLEKEQAK